MAPYVACPCDGHTPSPHQKTCPCAQRSPGDAGGSPPHAPVPIYTTFAMTEGRNMVIQPWYSENGRCTQTGKATAVGGSMCCGGRRHICSLLTLEVLAGMVLLDDVLDVQDSREVMAWRLGMVAMGHGNQ